MVTTVHKPCVCTPYVQESKKLRVLIINKDERKALARKNGNKNPIWSWNDSPVAMYERAESGISQLMVIPRTTHEIEEDIRREEAEAESQWTRTQSEALQMKKSDLGRTESLLILTSLIL